MKNKGNNPSAELSFSPPSHIQEENEGNLVPTIDKTSPEYDSGEFQKIKIEKPFYKGKIKIKTIKEKKKKKGSKS